MLAANNIWHWWIGVVLTLASVLAVVGLIGGYLKSVTSQRYPGKRNRRDD
jgi:hypothetical protein